MPERLWEEINMKCQSLPDHQTQVLVIQMGTLSPRLGRGFPRGSHSRSAIELDLWGEDSRD